MCLPVHGCSQPVNTDCGTDGIRIRILVSHDQHLILGLQYFSKGMCLYTCLHTGIFLNSLRFATIIINLLAILDNRLVAATSECQINGYPRRIICLNIRRESDTQSDA